MGAFFTNIQLRNFEVEKSSFADKVIEYLIKSNIEQGFIKVDKEDEADKTIIVSSAADLTWVSIYDEELEDQGPRKLNKLSSELSRQFNTTALSILVHDSDLMYIGLNVNGKLNDTLSNLSKQIDFSKNKPDVWSTILKKSYSFDDIKIAWKNKPLFVEDFLTEFAKLVGVDTSKLLTGYNYLSDEIPKDGVKLNFARKDKKEVPELGLTKFSMISGQGLVKVKCGDKYNTQWMITNHGTFSNGLDIVVTGECIEQGLLMPETAIVSYVKYKSNGQNEFISSFIKTVATTGENIYYVRLEDIYIPKGFQPRYPMTPKESKRYGKIWYDSAITFTINFIGQKPGNGNLIIFFSPLINRYEGSYCADFIKGQVSF